MANFEVFLWNFSLSTNPEIVRSGLASLLLLLSAHHAAAAVFPAEKPHLRFGPKRSSR